MGYRLPAANRKAGAEIRGRLQGLGVLRESGHEHLRGSLVIPIMDAHGRVANLYGRKIRDDLRAGTPDHLYLPGPHRGVFNVGAFAASDELILCEALIDALTFWCAGYRHVTSSYGVGGFKMCIRDRYTKQLETAGRQSLLRSQASLQGRLAEHEAKLAQYLKEGGYTSSVEKEIRNFKGELDAIKRVLGQ